jgi:DNA polymerase-3 subunit alpha
VTVFADLYTSVREIVVENCLLIIEGEVHEDDFKGGYTMIANKVISLEQARENAMSRLEITMTTLQVNDEVARRLLECLSPYKSGRCPVVIHYFCYDAHVELLLGEEWKVHPSQALIQQLKSWLGEDKVKII